MIAERRTQRSDQTAIALSLQLQACCERAGLSAMILSDSDGFLVAENQEGFADSEEVAAMLPLVVGDREFAGILVPDGSNGYAVQIRPFSVLEGEHLWLCAVGKAGETVGSEIDQAMAGVNRILN